MRLSCRVKRKRSSALLITALVGFFLVCYGCTAHAQKSSPTDSETLNPAESDNLEAQKPPEKTEIAENSPEKIQVDQNSPKETQVPQDSPENIQVAQNLPKNMQVAQNSGAQPPSGWVTNCTAEGRGKGLDCKIEQTLVVTKTQQRLLSIVVRVPAESRTPAMMIHLPLGLFLPAGIALQLDQNMSMKLNVQTCDVNGCYSGTPISENMLDAMKNGKQLTVSFQSLAKKTMSLPVPLTGFAEAYQKIR